MMDYFMFLYTLCILFVVDNLSYFLEDEEEAEIIK